MSSGKRESTDICRLPTGICADNPASEDYSELWRGGVPCVLYSSLNGYGEVKHDPDEALEQYAAYAKLTLL